LGKHGPELLSCLFLVPFPIPGAGLSHKKENKNELSSNKQSKKPIQRHIYSKQQHSEAKGITRESSLLEWG
jgi:hypothetical protein